MLDKSKRKHGPSVKEESVFGFFPAAKDIRALQSAKQWESVKSLLSLMRKQDGVPTPSTSGSIRTAMETRQRRTGPTGSAASTLASPGEGIPARLPPLQPSSMTPRVSVTRRLADLENEGENRKLPIGVSNGSQGQRSSCDSRARRQTQAFKNYTLIGYSCGQFKQLEEDYKDFYFQHSMPERHRYFYVHPEWLSEGLVARHLVKEQRPDPFRYGWP